MTENTITHGETLHSWSMPEFQKHKRGRVWHVVMIALAILLLLYALISTNFLFAIIILMFGVIIALTGMREPELIDVCITETGVKLHEHFYPYRDIKTFSIVYQPPEVKFLYLELGSGLHSHVTLRLEDEDPLEIRRILLEYVTEDLERIDEPFTEFLGRIFKL